jgi:hypothetical protein
MSFRSPKMDSQVECGGKISDGYYRINVFNTKRGIKYKFKNAAKDAVHAVLFEDFMDFQSNMISHVQMSSISNVVICCRMVF